MSKNVWLFETERLVYEGEGWGIIINDDPHHMRTYATHEACTVAHGSGETGSAYGALCWEKGIFSKCTNCRETVPDGIQGLVLMLNWEEHD